MCKKISEKDKKENSQINIGCISIIICIVILFAWGASWCLIDISFTAHDERGTFGDKFGAVNALFSGLAFAGLIVTLIYQKEELSLQRQELRETRDELKAQKEEFIEQNKTMKRQRFENTFFNMLSLQQEIIANLSYESKRLDFDILNPNNSKTIVTTYTSRIVFREIYLNEPLYEGFMLKGLKQIIQASGCNAYSTIQNTTLFDHYFRHLYRIFKYVDTSDLIENEERYDYACIIRSQLSDYELVMLFYNCLTENGRDKFKPLIEKYTIFNNLRDELLADVEHKNEYAKIAYDKNAI